MTSIVLDSGNVRRELVKTFLYPRAKLNKIDKIPVQIMKVQNNMKV